MESGDNCSSDAFSGQGQKKNAKQDPVRKEPPVEKLVMRLRTGIWNNKGKGWHHV
jgi:hypothetical protein